MENSVKKVVKTKTKTKFKVFGLLKSKTEQSTRTTITMEAPDFIEGVYSRLQDDVIEDVLPTDDFSDEEEL